MIRWDPSGHSWIGDEWDRFLDYMGEQHSSVESALGYWTFGFSDSVYALYRNPINSKEYWYAFTEVSLDGAFTLMGGKVAQEGTNLLVQSTKTAIKGTGKGLETRGYKPQPGERTFDGYVKKNVPASLP